MFKQVFFWIAVCFGIVGDVVSVEAVDHHEPGGCLATLKSDWLEKKLDKIEAEEKEAEKRQKKAMKEALEKN